MGEKMKKYLQEESAKEAEDILAMINADPDMADVHAPDELEAALFAQIDEYEKEKSHYSLSAEDKELIELGKVYKKRQKFRKYAAVASIALMGVVFSSVTAMGGPEKVVEKVSWILAGREQTNVDTDNDRIEVSKTINEEEALAQIEKEYGFTPVKMHYIPEGIDFLQYLVDKESQYINLLYQGNENRIIIFDIIPNYKMGSTGSDIEDDILREYSRRISEIEILVKHCKVQENGEERWVLEFTKDNIYYYIQICNVNEEEVETIIDNLYFL